MRRIASCVSMQLAPLLLLAPFVAACAATSSTAPTEGTASELPRAAIAPAAPGGEEPLRGPLAAEPTLPPAGAVPPALVAAASPRPSDAEPAHYPNMYRRFGLGAGVALLGNFDTTVQVTGDAGVGTILDLEDFLNVDDDTLLARMDVFYSFSPRHRIDIGVYDIGREGTETVGQDLVIGDVVIPAGDVTTELDTLIIKAAYRYNFVADARTAIGASFGFHTMGIDLSFDSQDFNVSESVGLTAPLPVLGLHGEYALGERWKLLASVEVFQVDLGFAGGYLADNRLSLENDLFDHFGWGIAFNGFQLDADFEDGSRTADLEYGYQGVLLYLRTYF